MDAVPRPFPGAGSSGGTDRWQGAILRGLHFLTCRICDPPPEVPDTARLTLALVTFGGSAALLATAVRSHTMSLVYCALGLARLLPARSRSCAVVGALSGATWLLLLSLPAPWATGAPAALAALSELCWLVTLRRVLDDEFDVFVAVLFLFLGVELTFGFYPMLMHWGPLVLNSKEVHETVQAVVEHASQAGQQGGSHSTHSGGMGGGNVGPLPHGQEPGPSSPLAVFSQALPLLALLVGVPGLAFAVLVSCWMLEHMWRMVVAVAVAFFSWMALYTSLAFLHVPVSRDTFGKAILGTACILMYHAFSRLTCVDLRAAQTRMLWLGGTFVTVFVLDQTMRGPGDLCPSLLFCVLVACKLAYSTWANFLEATGEGPFFRTKHLLPFKVARREERTQPEGGAAEDADTPTDGAREGADVPLRPDYI
uniref:Uncharacterized protein n=1 Tax=Pyrodinium bahamense TaxID=73915 RepID=A0A7S0BBT0_9DINO